MWMSSESFIVLMWVRHHIVFIFLMRLLYFFFFFFFSSRRRHTRFDCDWSSDVCSSDLIQGRRNAAEANGWGTGLQGLDFARFPQIGAKRSGPSRRSCRCQGPELRRSEERRVGKECRSRWSADH